MAEGTSGEVSASFSEDAFGKMSERQLQSIIWLNTWATSLLIGYSTDHVP